MFALDVLCFEPPFRFSPAQMRRFAEAQNARVVIAEEGGRLAGFCILHIEARGGERLGYIVTLDVRPELRRRGLGQQLMTAAELKARAAGCGTVALHVFTGNAGAVRFYETMGYVRTHAAPGFYGRGGNAWVYQKQLSDPSRGSD
jgi:ribosomal-protein-alanine N-acetyltransferase